MRGQRLTDETDCHLYPAERLSSFAEGELAGAEAERVRTHLACCPRCTAVLTELSSIMDAARTLDRPEPPATLWRAIEGVLERPAELPERRPARVPRWLRWRVFTTGALAGAAVAALVLGLLPAVHHGAEPPAPVTALAAENATDPLLAEAEAEFARAGAAYERSIEKLRGLLAREEPRWSPDERARYAERLAGLDEAIARSRELARRTPGDSVGNEQLLAAYQQKIAFLSAAVHRGGAWTGSPGEEIER
jgi:hypothetical protein